jgi:hypothetical protein
MAGDQYSASRRPLQAPRSLELLLFDTLGRAVILGNKTPLDSESHLIQTERQTLVRLKCILDVHNLKWRSKQDTIRMSRDSILRVLLHIMAIGSSKKSFRGLDYSICRRLTMNAILAAFEALNLWSQQITMEEEDFIRTGLDDLMDTWKNQQEVSEIEHRVLFETVSESFRIQGELKSKWNDDFRDLSTKNFMTMVRMSCSQVNMADLDIRAKTAHGDRVSSAGRAWNMAKRSSFLLQPTMSKLSGICILL